MSVLYHVLYYTLIQEVYTYCKSHNVHIFPDLLPPPKKAGMCLIFC